MKVIVKSVLILTIFLSSGYAVANPCCPTEKTNCSTYCANKDSAMAHCSWFSAEEGREGYCSCKNGVRSGIAPGSICTSSTEP